MRSSELSGRNGRSKKDAPPAYSPCGGKLLCPELDISPIFCLQPNRAYDNHPLARLAHSRGDTGPGLQQGRIVSLEDRGPRSRPGHARRRDPGQRHARPVFPGTHWTPETSDSERLERKGVQRRIQRPKNVPPDRDWRQPVGGSRRNGTIASGRGENGLRSLLTSRTAKTWFYPIVLMMQERPPQVWKILTTLKMNRFRQPPSP